MTSMPTVMPSARLDYTRRPMLVFWESTRACQLACRHCRASATAHALPGELTTAEGRDLIDQVAGFDPCPDLLIEPFHLGGGGLVGAVVGAAAGLPVGGAS